MEGNMHLQVIEHNKQRVLTTSLLAEYYGVDEKQIYDNFTNNKDRYEEGKHFFCLKGDELREFKGCPEYSGIVSKNAPSLYLWTEKGAAMHAKSLTSEAAWRLYETLVDEYFRMATTQIALQGPLDSYMIENPKERAKRWIEEYEEKEALQQTVQVQQIQIEEQKETIVEQTEAIETMTPKAAYCDVIMGSPLLMSVSEIAKDYGMTAKAFNIKLQELGIQYNVGGVWTLFTKHQNQGYTKTKPVTGGNGKAKNRTYWTHKGRLFLYEVLKENGILPKVERD